MNGDEGGLPDGAGLSIGDVLSLEVLQAGEPEVLTGHSRLDTPVRWIHIAEDPDTSALLTGGELVLTTGLNFRASAASTGRFLERFLAAGAAGIVVEIADDGAAADRLRAAAATVGGVVVLLHRTVRYVDVTEQVHRVLMDQQLARVRRGRHIHEVYTALSLRDAGEQHIVDTTAELIGAPVVFEDVAHLVLSYNAGGAQAAWLLADWQQRSRMVGYSAVTEATPAAGAQGAGAAGGRAPDDGAPSEGAADDGAPPSWMQTPVGLAGQRWGRLVVPVAPADATDAVQVIERAGQALTMARMAGRDRQELLHQTRAGFIHDLRQTPGPAERDALARAESLGLVPGAGYVPVVVRLDRAEAEPPTALQLRERELLESLEQTAATSRQSVLAAGIHTGSVALLLSVPARQLEEPALQRLFGVLDAEAAPWSVGVGAAQPSLTGAAAGLEEATQVAEIAATLETRSRRYYRFADVRLRGLLSVLADDARVRAFAGAELAGLGEDEEGLQLLEEYLRHGGNKAALARDGYLSRQALYPRLARLEEKLGVSLDDAESRAALHVAVLWHRLAGAPAQ